MRSLLACIAAGAALAACLTAPQPSPVMTPARVEEILRAEAITEFTSVDGQLRFAFSDVRMACVMDRRLDRLRLVAPVVRDDELSVAHARVLLEANFHNTLDARYALRGDVLFAVYGHPLASLTNPQLRSAVRQVASLVLTFGTTYSSGVLELPLTP